jgi:hypothetical protein
MTPELLSAITELIRVAHLHFGGVGRVDAVVLRGMSVRRKVTDERDLNRNQVWSSPGVECRRHLKVWQRWLTGSRQGADNVKQHPISPQVQALHSAN